MGPDVHVPCRPSTPRLGRVRAWGRRGFWPALTSIASRGGGSQQSKPRNVPGATCCGLLTTTGMVLEGAAVQRRGPGALPSWPTRLGLPAFATRQARLGAARVPGMQWGGCVVGWGWGGGPRPGLAARVQGIILGVDPCPAPTSYLPRESAVTALHTGGGSAEVEGSRTRPGKGAGQGHPGSDGLPVCTTGAVGEARWDSEALPSPKGPAPPCPQPPPQASGDLGLKKPGTSHKGLPWCSGMSHRPPGMDESCKECNCSFPTLPAWSWSPRSGNPIRDPATSTRMHTF